MFPKDVGNVKQETTEEFLARGGKINKIAEGDTYKRKTRKPLPFDAQGFLDKALGTEHEAEAIAWLERNGYDVF
jgi:hypothetical protein